MGVRDPFGNAIRILQQKKVAHKPDRSGPALGERVRGVIARLAYARYRSIHRPNPHWFTRPNRSTWTHSVIERNPSEGLRPHEQNPVAIAELAHGDPLK